MKWHFCLFEKPYLCICNLNLKFCRFLLHKKLFIRKFCAISGFSAKLKMAIAGFYCTGSKWGPNEIWLKQNSVPPLLVIQIFKIGPPTQKLHLLTCFCHIQGPLYVLGQAISADFEQKKLPIFWNIFPILGQFFLLKIDRIENFIMQCGYFSNGLRFRILLTLEYQTTSP